MSFFIQAILALLLCYLAGSVLFGLIIAETMYGVDIRQFGSGNVGFTNIKRTLGWKPALGVLVLDALKGVLAVWISRRVFLGHAGQWEQYLVLLGGVLSIIGHNWSAFFNFAGGKGVATSLGVLFALDPKVGVLAMVVGFPLLLYPGYMSLASTVGAASVPIWFRVLGDPLPYQIFGTLVFLFVLVRHRTNWQRIREGTESRFSFRGRSEARSTDAAENGAPAGSAAIPGKEKLSKAQPGSDAAHRPGPDGSPPPEKSARISPPPVDLTADHAHASDSSDRPDKSERTQNQQ